MPYISSYNTRIKYEVLGENNKEMIVLISGLNTKTIRWKVPSSEYLVNAGFRIMIDNQGGGRCNWKHHNENKITIHSLAVFLKNPSEDDVPYTLKSVAEDIRCAMVDLGFKKVQGVARSTRGIIAQLLTFHYPSLVKTLTIMISSSLNPALPKTDPNLVGLLTRIPKDYLRRNQACMTKSRRWKECIGDPNYKVNSRMGRNFIIEEINRNNGKIKPFRQRVALSSYVYNKPMITATRIPILNNHGINMPLFHPKNAKELADSLPDSRLILIEHRPHSILDVSFMTIAEEIKLFINS